MKCYNFLCPIHKDYIPNIACGFGILPEYCKARKRYNRIASGIPTIYSAFSKPEHLEDKFFIERNKYHGRK